MAAPATISNSGLAVEKLQSLFPTINRSEIQKILLTDCSGDSTRAIIILTRIHEFNQSIPNANNNKGETARSGEHSNIVTVHAIPLLSPNNIALNVNNDIIQPQSVKTADTCCNCNGCCACCLLKPASYSNGLYAIDKQMYRISFIIFFAMNIYSETNMVTFESSKYGLYLPSIAISMMFIASIIDLRSNSKGSFVIALLFVFGGLLYFLGYIVHAKYLFIDCGGYSCGDNVYYPKQPYLIGRGIFIGFHAMFYGFMKGISWNDTMNKVLLHNRSNLIRFWILLFIVLCVPVYTWSLPEWSYVLVYCAMSPWVLGVALIVTFVFSFWKSDEGGCNAMIVMSIIILCFYYIAMAMLCWTTIVFGLHFNNVSSGMNCAIMFYRLSMLVFPMFHVWIMTRAMHPASAKCGCKQDGVDLSLYLEVNNEQPAPIAMESINVAPQY